jgi:hypothetical protein
MMKPSALNQNFYYCLGLGSREREGLTNNAKMTCAWKKHFQWFVYCDQCRRLERILVMEIDSFIKHLI